MNGVFYSLFLIFDSANCRHSSVVGVGNQDLTMCWMEYIISVNKATTKPPQMTRNQL